MSDEAWAFVAFLYAGEGGSMVADWRWKGFWGAGWDEVVWFLFSYDIMV